MNQYNIVDRDSFDQWCRESLFSENIQVGADLLQQALDAHLLNLFRELEWSQYFTEQTTALSLSEKLDYAESAHIAINAILERLSRRFSFLEKYNDGADGATSFRCNAEPPLPKASLSCINKKMSQLGDDFATTLAFLQYGYDQFEHSLRVDPDFMDRVLTGREPGHEKIWFEATNVDPLQDVHGIMGAVAIDLLLKSGDILEIGGGTGNGIRNLFAHLQKKNRLDKISRYVFSDVSQKFIMSTRREIKRDYPDINTEWRFADLNKSMADQKLSPSSFDLVYAVNAAHVAKDILDFLQQCHKTLRPGGWVVLAERVRDPDLDMAPRELVLNLSDYHRTAAKRNSQYRPAHAYLSNENWETAFQLAGFNRVEIWPDEQKMKDVFSEHYASVVVAQKHAP